jgi:trans-aconitate methyltransferase
LKIEDYLASLPQGIISGEEVQLSEKSFREIFNFVKLEENDIFYHLGCGDGTGVKIAVEEFKVKKGIGIDNNRQKINQAENFLGNYYCENIKDSDFSDATVILFWFTDEKITKQMMEMKKSQSK